MSNSLFKTPSFSPQVKHNGFDMSMRRLFTSPVGMMLPVYTDIVQANDKYKLNVDAFIRTQAVKTCAFQNFKAHFDWFFVPFRQMYQFWNEFYNGTFDANTNYVTVNSKYSLPLSTFDFSPQYLDEHNDHDVYDLFFYNVNGQIRAQIDEFGTPRLANACRLADLLGYGDLHRFLTSNAAGDMPFTFFPYKYLAYHKIFYHPKFNRGDWFARRTDLFNVDSYHGSQISAAQSASILCKLHYRPFHRDYFSGIFPNPVFSKDFANIVSDSWLQNSAYPLGMFAPEYAQPTKSSDGANKLGIYSGYTIGGDANNMPQLQTTQRIDVDSLNALYDFDKLCRITALAGSHYTDQLQAHFGVTVNNDIHNEAYFIGSQSLDISVSEVVATASTGSGTYGENLGDIAGKGFGVSGRDGDLYFHAKEQGVLMCVFSIEPLQMYKSTMIERNGLYKGPLDFYRRELDNLGMQPMLFSELHPYMQGVNTTLLGYNYRYAELKTKVDVVNLGMTSVNQDWQCNFQDSIEGHTTNKDWRFYVNPSYTDSIFLQQYIKPPFILSQPGEQDNSDWSDLDNIEIYKGDNFLINAQFNVLKDSIMSVHSLPSLN